MKRRLKRFLKSTTTHLATTYLLIIMLMSIGFSIVFYNVSLDALRRQVPPNDNYFRRDFSSQTAPTTAQPPNTRIRDFLNERATEGRHDLLIRLVILNSSTLIIGGLVSYYLARRTLRPIEQAMEAQFQFVSDASHELRTPLTAIQTTNEVTLRNKKLTLAEAKAVIRDNTLEAAKLKQLSDGLLNLAQSDTTQPKLVDTPIQSAVQQAVNQVLEIAQAKQITIDDAAANLSVLSSPHVLRQVLVILLDNAIKYSPNKTTIHVLSETRGNYLFLSVRDEGVGIRASDMPHVFRRFYRSDAARSNGHQQGYGLGLAIAESLLTAHEASISVTSQLHKGSTFIIKLRLQTKSRLQ